MCGGTSGSVKIRKKECVVRQEEGFEFGVRVRLRVRMSRDIGRTRAKGEG